MHKVVTLKDVSEATGVSLTSVHRAIYNKEGISEELRRTILNKAEELGYKTNYAAASLKRKALRLAIALPDGEGSGRLYYHYFWKACRDYYREINGLNVQLLEFAFSSEESQLQVLGDIYRTHGSELDGLLTVPLRQGDEIRHSIERFIERGTQVVLVDNDLPDTRRLCCISPHDTSIGRLGAELLSSMVHRPGKVLVSVGSDDNSSHIHNMKGFTTYLEENELPLTVHKVYGYEDVAVSYRQAREFLEANREDVVGFYAVTARKTIPLCQAVLDVGLAGRIRGVGSDLFPESARMLRENVVQALIYKNPYEKAYRGFKILWEALIKKIHPADPSVAVPIGVIMKNNLRFYQDYI